MPIMSERNAESLRSIFRNDLASLLSRVIPLGDRVIVRRCKANAHVGKLGILVAPEIAEGRQQEGVVIAVGDGEISRKTGKRLPMDVKLGDRVLFGYFAGDTEKAGDDPDLLVMREDEIIAVIE